MGKKGILSIVVVLVGGAISALGSEMIGEYVFGSIKEKATDKLEKLPKQMVIMEKEDDAK